MSLFEEAQKIVSDILKDRESSMLSLSMGMQPVMPMAQGGGLSSVQNSLNINGQPHRLAYINPNEEDLLKSLGGSGEKIDGIPAYFEDSDPGSGDTTGGFGAPGTDDPGSSDNTNPGFGTPGDPSFGTPSTDDPDSSDNTNPGFGTPGDPSFGTPSDPSNPSFTSQQTFEERGALSKGKGISIDMGLFSFLAGVFGGPVAAALGGLADSALGTSMSVDTGIGATHGGYGDTGTGNQGGGGQDGDDGNDGNDGDTAGDIIIKEKIAAVRQVPVEEVTVAEVQRAKRLTAAQRVTGTRIEDILDDIYGSGKGAGLLGIPTNNTGTA